MTINPRNGVKFYDNDWFLRYDLGARGRSRPTGVLERTYVTAQSRWPPMQDSAVASAVAVTHQLPRPGHRAFRDLLAAHGIGYFACLNE